MDYTILTEEETIWIEKLMVCLKEYHKKYKSCTKDGAYIIYNNSLKEFWTELEENHKNEENWTETFIEKLISLNLVATKEKHKWDILINKNKRVYFDETSIDKMNFIVKQKRRQHKKQKIGAVKNLGFGVLGGLIASILFEFFKWLIMSK
jgi:hypothetical protein